MTNKNIYRSLGGLDPELIAKAAPAEKVQKKKRNGWVKWASLAACFALIITASMLLYPSVVEDISSDGYENLYLFGGITVNMNGIFWAFFIAPVFSVVCTFLMWLIDSGSIILPLWLIRDLCIPILHFCILKRCIKKSKIQKKSTIWLVIALLLVTVAADSFVLEYLILKGRLAIPHIIFRLIWAILCGLFILGHTLVERFYRNNIRCNIMVAVGSTIALCSNAFMTYLLAPTLATKYAIDGIELLLMPLSIIILSVYSHLLGRIMTRRFMFVKLTGWLLGIIASEFVTLWLLGTPRILPTEDKVTTIIWIVVSAFVFIWCLIGVLKTHLEDIKQSLAEKRKPTNRTWVKWTSLAAACFALLICALPIMNLIFEGSHSDAPISNNYNSLEEVHTALGYDTLYSKLDLDESNTKRISISYDSINGDNGLEANLEKPLQLQIRAAYPNGETTDSVDYYIIFNRDSVDDSYIGGYEEQGLTKEINGITVHYSLIQDGAMHGQAKFLYEGNLYVIDVNSWGNEYNLDTYIDMVLN